MMSPAHRLADVLRQRPARRRLGLGVSSMRVSAVVMDRERIIWAANHVREEATPLRETIRALLAEYPGKGFAHRWARPRVTVAIGAAAAQLKRVSGISDAASSEGLPRDHLSRFFLVNGVPVSPSGIRWVDAHTGWVAAVDAPVITEVRDGCRDGHWRLHGVVPTAVALERAVEESRFAVADGDIVTDISFAGGRLDSARRIMRSGGADLRQPRLVSALRALGESGSVVADAFGAAHIAKDEPLAISDDAGAARAAPSRARTLRAGSACVLAIIMATFAPAFLAARQGAAARVRLVALGPQLRATLDSQRLLARTTAALASFTAFEQSRQPVTILLSDITRALPAESALLEFQVDSSGAGTLVALAPRAAQVVGALERVPGVTSPAIVGPVTQDAVGGHSLDRVTVRFVLVPSSQRAVR
ncbi:MAG TPA: hypothetical protein VF722_12305 [Gemmatimonadaceae bacterium]